MSNNIEHTIRVSLEVGSSKVIVIVGNVLSDGVVNVLGFGSAPTRGIERGSVTDLDAVTNSIRRAVDQAESMSNMEISAVTLAITGAHIRTVNHTITTQLENGEVTHSDLENAMQRLRMTLGKLHDDTEILHIIPQEYRVDNLPRTKNPIGLQGMELKTQVHLITCHKDWLANLEKAVERARLKIDEPVFSGLASSESVLTEEEKELGVCLVDIGGGTIDICVYTDGSLRYSKVLPFAGNDITNYIVSKFAISRNEAERIKVKEGSAITPPTHSGDKRIEVVGLGGRAPCLLTKGILSTETSLCYNQLLQIVQQELQQCKLGLMQKGIKSDLIAGIVLTGGGSEVQDIVECAKSVFGAQVRVGVPLNISGITDHIRKPQYATAFGLLQYGYLNNEVRGSNVPPRGGKGKWRDMIERFGRWIKSNI